jgi:hypothetical protein
VFIILSHSLVIEWAKFVPFIRLRIVLPDTKRQNIAKIANLHAGQTACRTILPYPILGELIDDHVHLHGNPNAPNHVFNTRPVDDEIHPLVPNCMEAIEHDHDLL